MADICGDGRFEIIEKAKKALFDSTNISDSPDEMKGVDTFLFRCWQMGWLDKYDETAKYISKKECGDCAIWKQMEWIPVNEKLPEIGEYVLTCGKQGGMETIMFRGLLCKDGNRDVWAWKKNSSKRIIAWKPIEPYEETND